ncbi:hypothetical protein GCM10010199_42070 [Dactylosporangium roseum]
MAADCGGTRAGRHTSAATFSRPSPNYRSWQCRLVWDHIAAVLAEADLTTRNLAKVTTYLADRRYREANARIRAEVLGDHRPALTIIITDIYSEAWLL